MTARRSQVQKPRSTGEDLNLVLRSLQEKLRHAYDLEKVVYLPGKQVRNPEGNLIDGEVKNGIVYIYTEQEPAFVLKHELLEYLLSQDKRPLMDLLSKVLAHLMYSQYQNSEKLADALARVL